jgi:hypothetical protein
MLHGSCLCGGVRFEVAHVVGPFELCHCPRCRKASGSAFVAGVGARVDGFRLVSGAELVRTFEAPILRHPPPYRVAFCTRCGSPVPDPPAGATWLEIPAGTLDDDPGLRPERHIFVDHKSPWYAIVDGLPQLTMRALAALRRREESRLGPERADD